MLQPVAPPALWPPPGAGRSPPVRFLNLEHWITVSKSEDIVQGEASEKLEKVLRLTPGLVSVAGRGPGLNRGGSPG